MTKITKTSLPGVGVKHEFSTEDGRRVGVVHHRTGKRELYVCAAADPDVAVLNVALTDDDSHALSDALGGSEVVENLAHLQQRVEGLAIGWLPVEEDSKYASRTIGDARIRTRTGVSVVAIIRGHTGHPAPGPGFEMLAGDTLVVVGTPEGIEQVEEILSVG
ncbi:MAG TPA: cation:proton antiporter regulatory subunit [Acidimicrobiia bacterium]|jgi:TrkA domain protein|nr:cation:proton antiporter regulatory subunit [Acidimicrobiia bacterium]